MLIILTALLCEATPIISTYKLKKQTEINAFQVYQKDQISLVVSGIGKTAAASATGFIYAWSGSKPNLAWLNIGIAGHSELELATGFIANKIIDRATEKTFFPPLIFKPPCLTDLLHTVDQPDGEYLQKGGVDMEAAAFYATASRFSSGELVHCYKVVSDNKQSPVRKFSKQEASAMIEKNMPDINKLIEQLLLMSNNLDKLNDTSELFNKINAQIRLTHSEQLQIKDRLKNVNLLNPDIPDFLSDTLSSLSAKEIIQRLDKIIDTQEIHF